MRIRNSCMILLLLFIGHGTSRAQWNQINAYDSTMGYRDVFFLSDNIGFVVGYKSDSQNGSYPGVILRTLDGGNSWDTTFTNNFCGLRCVYFSDMDTGYAGGFGGVILKTVDGGSTWVNLAQPFGNVPWLACHFTSGDTGYFSCTSVGPHIVIKTTDGGQTWTQLADTAGNVIGGHAIYFANPDTGLVITSGPVYKTTDGGFSWIQVPLLPSACAGQDVHFIDGMNGFVAGNGFGGQWGNYGSIATTADGGQTWTTQSFYNIFRLEDMTFAPSGRGYAGGQSNSFDDLQMLSTLDDGATWFPQQVNHGLIIPTFMGISAPSDSVAYAVSLNGLIYKTTNAGGPLLSTNEIETQGAINIYPNPGSDVVTFQFSDAQQSHELIICDGLGREVWREEMSGSSLTISVQGFSEGIYFYSVTGQNGASVKGKFLVQ